jgi:hypothetical protein
MTRPKAAAKKNALTGRVVPRSGIHLKWVYGRVKNPTAISHLIAVSNLLSILDLQLPDILPGHELFF